MPRRRACAQPALALLTSLALLGCASRSSEIAPLPASPAQFASWSCERIDDEADAVQRRAADLAWAVDERSGNNVVALSLGVTVFWPALLALRPHGPEAEDLARLKGRYEALREAAARRGCAPPSAELPAAQAAALPVAAGERLVYEERLDARHAATERVWVLAALRRDEFEYVPRRGGASASTTAPAPATASASTPASPPSATATAAPVATLRHDRAGNVFAAPAGMLIWPQLLRGELALGQVMAGELQLMGDSFLRARVRTQVVAIGPQQVGTRRFDAVVVELYGDVLQGVGSTRLDGVLVVDRASGVLLRLDLRSAQPPFQGTRRLLRVDAAGAP